MLVLSLIALHTLLLAPALTLSHGTNDDDYSVLSNHHVPAGWQRIGNPDQDFTVRLKIGIKHRAFGELESHLDEISDPDNERYGRYLSSTDTHRYTAPSTASLSATHSWLASQGVDLSKAMYSPSKDWIMIVLPLFKVEALLHTKYHTYVDQNGGQLVRTTSYSLPKSLHQHIDVIQPTNSFGIAEYRGRQASHPSAPYSSQQITLTPRHPLASDDHLQSVKTACSQANVTISCLRVLYRTLDYVPQIPNNNSVGFTNYLGESPQHDDLRLWLQKFRPDAESSYTFASEVIANGTNNQSVAYHQTYEGNMDVQILAGLIYPTRLIAYSIGGRAPWQYREDAEARNTSRNDNEPHLTFLDWLLQKHDNEIPNIISTSYGEDESSVPLNYAQRVCSEFAILSARGVTVLFGAGDTGVGENHMCGETERFRTYFPASCPYVTAVGATSGAVPEEVGHDDFGILTGGGFSQYFPQPQYQLRAVERYLDSIGTLHATKYNRSGRAYPDIAAHGSGFGIINRGELSNATGTSVAVQVAAGVLANVNDALLAVGRPRLGFLNPWLYKYTESAGAGFNDITHGNMTGCNTTGFPSIEGWDVASGWGTPDFKNILASMLKG